MKVALKEGIDLTNKNEIESLLNTLNFRFINLRAFIRGHEFPVPYLLLARKAKKHRTSNLVTTTI